jgi:hypothetical protein
MKSAYIASNFAVSDARRRLDVVICCHMDVFGAVTRYSKLVLDFLATAALATAATCQP